MKSLRKLLNWIPPFILNNSTPPDPPLGFAYVVTNTGAHVVTNTGAYLVARVPV